MSACTFFGHRDCCGLDKGMLLRAIEDLICQGVETFYVGNEGAFDWSVYSCLKKLRERYPRIRVCVVLAYLPAPSIEQDMADAMYPPIEGHPKFAIERRNRWMIASSDYCLCYINHSWGGAYKFAMLAKGQGLPVVNLGALHLEMV